MNTRRILLIGGPGTGKTTLLNALKKEGFPVFEELSRQVIQQAQRTGVDQLFLTDPLVFSQQLLEGRVAQFRESDTLDRPIAIYDRGIPDVVAYLRYVGESYPASFDIACAKNKYDQVFVLPPWEEIHEVDGERYEDFAKAEAIHDVLLNTYADLGYSFTEIPKTTVEKRVAFMVKYLRP